MDACAVESALRWRAPDLLGFKIHDECSGAARWKSSNDARARR